MNTIVLKDNAHKLICSNIMNIISIMEIVSIMEIYHKVRDLYKIDKITKLHHNKINYNIQDIMSIKIKILIKTKIMCRI